MATQKRLSPDPKVGLAARLALSCQICKFLHFSVLLQNHNKMLPEINKNCHHVQNDPIGLRLNLKTFIFISCVVKGEFPQVRLGLRQPRTQGLSINDSGTGRKVLNSDWPIKNAKSQVENTRKPPNTHCEDRLSSLSTDSVQSNEEF